MEREKGGEGRWRVTWRVEIVVIGISQLIVVCHVLCVACVAWGRILAWHNKPHRVCWLR